MTAVPPNTDALTILPVRNAGAELINHAHHLMSWNTWVLNSRPRAFFRESVTAADATGLYLHPHVSRARIRHLAVNDLEFSSRLGNLRHLHRCACDCSDGRARACQDQSLRPLNFRPPRNMDFLGRLTAS